MRKIIPCKLSDLFNATQVAMSQDHENQGSFQPCQGFTAPSLPSEGISSCGTYMAPLSLITVATYVSSF